MSTPPTAFSLLTFSRLGNLVPALRNAQVLVPVKPRGAERMLSQRIWRVSWAALAPGRAKHPYKGLCNQHLPVQDSSSYFITPSFVRRNNEARVIPNSCLARRLWRIRAEYPDWGPTPQHAH